ncbi:hypothetical protein GQX73_g10432 [Xylaria multiplex]|uniref:Uncharacterized protein n=1 Tax=Xylaria multiplex TaxID=323545 RepID=A0A7C8MIH5_9PEZI|nr:hypothetical protein GQX73_g10432 [Xylaria multiplex]
MTVATITVATEPSSDTVQIKEEGISTDIESQPQDDNGVKNDGSNYRKPAEHLTTRLKVKLFVIDSLTSAVLGGGINFGVAYATYNNQAAGVHLFSFPNALAADCSFTLLAQFVITWLVLVFIGNNDLRKGWVDPIGFVREPKGKFLRWYFLLDRENQMPHQVKGWLNWVRFVWSNVLRSLMLFLIFFPPTFGVSIGALSAVGTKTPYGDWNFPDTYAPQIYKLIFGLVIGSTATPLISLYTLLRVGWILKASERAQE